MEIKKKENFKRFFAIVALIVLFALILILAYALITANGNLAMAMIFSLIFISIFLFVFMRIFKIKPNNAEFENNDTSEKK